jgi:hypothetical protein
MKTKKLYALTYSVWVTGEELHTTLRGLSKAELKTHISTKLGLWAEQGIKFSITEDWTDR